MGRQQARPRQRGQGALEFALVSPVLLALLIGLLEAGLLLFGTISANFAAADAARGASERGDALNADTFALSKIQATILNTTTVLQVDEVDIYKVTPSGGGNYTNVNNCVDGTQQCVDSYKLDGTPILQNWPPSARNVSNASPDYLAVTIHAKYNWLTGFFSYLGPVTINPTYYVRLEPQTY